MCLIKENYFSFGGDFSCKIFCLDSDLGVLEFFFFKTLKFGIAEIPFFSAMK